MRGHSGRYGVNGDTACGGGEGGGYRICDMSESVWVWIDCSEKCRVASKELRVRGKRAPASPEKKKTSERTSTGSRHQRREQETDASSSHGVSPGAAVIH